MPFIVVSAVNYTSEVLPVRVLRNAKYVWPEDFAYVSDHDHHIRMPLFSLLYSNVVRDNSLINPSGKRGKAVLSSGA